MNGGEDTQAGFGTGLRAALARAGSERPTSEPPPQAPPPDEAISPELALVTPELRPRPAAAVVAVAAQSA